MDAAGVAESEEKGPEEGLQREGGEKKKVVLLLSARTRIVASSPTTPLSFKGLKINLLKANPVKRTNPVKQSSASSSVIDKSFRKRKNTTLTVAEKLIL